jgi:hypothetical protein
MNVAHQLGKVAVPVADNRFVPILKKMPVPMMAQIVAHCIARQKTPHKLRQSPGAAAQEYVGVIAHQRPCVNRCTGLIRHLAQPHRKVPPITPVIHDPSFFDPPDHHVVQGSRTI